MQFRTRKDSTQSIAILGKHWNHVRGEYSFLHDIYSSEPLPNKLDYDCRLQLTTQLGEFYLCIPMPLAVRPENQGPTNKCMIALDPGIRTFVTGYDPSGRAVEWGKHDIGRIYRLCYAVDDLQSRWTADPAVRHHKRWKMKRAAMRLRKKIRSLVDEFHRKLAKWLCESYSLVLLPTFETSQILPRGQRRINNKTARAMATWAGPTIASSSACLTRRASMRGAVWFWSMRPTRARPVAAVASCIKAWVDPSISTAHPVGLRLGAITMVRATSTYDI
jgi:hypothetical protein